MQLRILKLSDPQTSPDRVLFLLPGENQATAEDLAMLQALYSRDPAPIDDHVKLMKTANSGEFMKKFYVGYGHESIAELGQVIIAIENVPMPVAKLIQHSQLYKGQECSTRYLDFSKQPFASRTPAGQRYQERLREFYLRSFAEVSDHLVRRHDLDPNDPVQTKAARAATFDVLRGFLPNGALTNLSWTTDLRHLNHRLEELEPHTKEFPELEPVLDKIRKLFQEAFPYSYRPPRGGKLPTVEYDDGVMTVPDNIDFTSAMRETYLEWEGFIDFASWRDLARHRSVRQTFPRLSTKLGFESWYPNQLPISLQGEAIKLLEEAKEMDDVLAIPMAYRVPFFLSGPLDKFHYIIRLRSAQTVHPTLRLQILKLVESLHRWSLMEGLEGGYDDNPEWLVGSKRGTQDITRKDATVS